MPDENHSTRVAALQHQVSTLTSKHAEAKAIVQKWTDAGVALARSAAEARAENQGAGRGFLGGLLGSKFRGAMRAGAAASNADLARQVAEQRARIADGKRTSQEIVRAVQEQLSVTNQELKALTAESKVKARTKVAGTKAASQSLQLLHKLKEAREAGLLTETEYEEKRIKMVSEL